MGLKEKLEVLVDANVQGFVRGMETAGASAEKNLGKTDNRLQVMAGRMQSWGAAAVGGAAVAAVGLGKLASMAAEAEVAQAKLTNSIQNSSQTFKNNGAALIEQANALQKVTASDDEAIKGAQAILVQFGLTENQVKTLTPLVNDLSRKFGIDLPAAAKAVGKATQGSGGALSRYGILLDKTALSTDGFGATVQGLQSKVGGFAQQEGQTFAGQLEIIKNQMAELGEGVGKGVTTTLSDLVGGLVNVSGALSDIDPGITAAVGSFATLATAGVGALGALSFVAGSAIKLKSSFAGLTAPLRDAEGALTGVGKAAAVGGAAIAGAAIVGAVIEIGNAYNKASQDAAKFEEALAVLSGGKSGNSAVATANGLNALTGSVDSFSESVDGLGAGPRAALAAATLGISEVYRAANEAFGNDSNMTTNIGGITADLNQLGEFTDKLGDTGNITAMQAALDQLSYARSHNTDLTSEGKDALDQGIGSLKTSIKVTTEQAAASRSAEAAAAKDVAKRREIGIANKEYAATSEDVAESIKAIDVALAGATAAYSSGQAAAKGWAEAVGMSSGLLNDSLDSAQGVGSAFGALKENIKALPQGYNELTASVGGYNEKQNKALDALQGVGGAVQKQLGSLLASGAGYAQVTDAAKGYETQLRMQLHAVGINGEAQDQYIKLLGLTPDQVNTAVLLSGTEQAKQQLQVLQGDFDNLPPEKQSQIYALIAKNDWTGALELYKQFLANKNANVNATVTGLSNWFTAKSWYDGFRDKTVNITTNSLKGKDWAGNPISQANGGIMTFAAGGMTLPTNAIIQPGLGNGLVQWAEGETGGEAFIPLSPSKRKRSKDIWWQTGQRLGVVPMADGGITSFANGGFTTQELAFFKAVDAQRRFYEGIARQQAASQTKWTAQQMAFFRAVAANQKAAAKQDAFVAKGNANAAGFTSDNPLGQYVEATNNYWKVQFDAATTEAQLKMAEAKRDSFSMWSDDWTRYNDIAIQKQQELQRAQLEQASAAAAALRDVQDNQFQWQYDHADSLNKLQIAMGKRDSFAMFTDDWVRWAKEVESLQAQGIANPRSIASGGRSTSGGGAPFYLTVNVNAQGLVADPSEVGRQVVGAIKSYEQQNGTTWRT